MAMKKRVAVIGAGTSGLVAIKCCLDEGIEPVCYEKTKDIGGLWCFREDTGAFKTSTVFRSTVTNTSKEIMAFSDFPMPKEYPNYMQNTYINRYLNLYADKFDLKRHVIFNINVKLISPSADYDVTGRWTMELEDGNGRQWTETYDAVLVCNGHHDTPYLPDFPGLEDFQGDVVHTKDYKRLTGYEDKRVLVIGIGNSACDAAAELARIASTVYLSVREGVWLMSRLQDKGLPLDITGIRRLYQLIPRSIVEWNVWRQINNKFDHTMYPLKPKHGFFAKSPTVNDELPYQIANGNIVIKPNISRFTKTGVTFEDGTHQDIDCVIMATGYLITLPVDSSLIEVHKNRVDLYRNVFPPDMKHPTLAVIGLTSQMGPVNPISEMQCRWATRLIKGICKLPSKQEMERHIKKYRDDLKKKSADSQRSTIMVDVIAYIDEIASDIGVKPQLGKLLFQDPLLALQCFFGPYYPYQYRLMGPGKWDGAKEAIQTAWDRITGAYQTRKIPEDEAGFTIIVKTLILAIVFTAVVYVLLY